MQAWVDQHAPPPPRRRLGGGVADEEDDVDRRLADRVGPNTATWTEGGQGGGVPLDEVEGRVDIALTIHMRDKEGCRLICMPSPLIVDRPHKIRSSSLGSRHVYESGERIFEHDRRSLGMRDGWDGMQAYQNG